MFCTHKNINNYNIFLLQDKYVKIEQIIYTSTQIPFKESKPNKSKKYSRQIVPNPMFLVHVSRSLCYFPILQYTSIHKYTQNIYSAF